jgi:uncharacterized MAPEG superfamily protein
MTIPFACVIVAFVLIYAVKIPIAFAMRAAGNGRYDNHHPRDVQARLDGWGKRAVSAHQNAFEAFAPFAASVFVAHLGHANERTSAILAVTFVGARIVYPVLYVADQATLRSSIWGIGWAATLGLFLSPLF